MTATSSSDHVLRRGADHATVVEVGGAIRSYVASGRELLDGFGPGQTATGARGLPLLPWPNRIRDGRYTWDGEVHQLAITEEDKQAALHGLVGEVSWAVEQPSAESVVCTHVLRGETGYPFDLELRLAYELTDDGLVVATTARNIGSAALPYGAGAHPYLAPLSATVDDCELTAPASAYLPPDERGTPTDIVSVAGTEVDFRTGRRIGETKLDMCFTQLARDPDGRCEVRLTDPQGRGAALWFDETYPYVQLYTGDTLPEQDRRRRGLAVEPMTCPPNAFQSGVDVIRLEPGESTTCTWGVRPLL